MAKPISGNKQTLKMIFKEALELISEEQAAKLAEGYRSGEKNVVFVFGENSRGRYYKTAFSCFTVPHSVWKLYTEKTTLEIEIRPELPGDLPTGGVN
jgi:hypothetical protein